MSLVFVNGWGVTVEEAEVAIRSSGYAGELRVVQPGPHWLAEVAAGGEEGFAAYSTGAYLALSSPESLRRFRKATFLAPFFDFKAEAGMGGLTRAAQLKFLVRWLRRDALAAVNDFRKRSGCGGELKALPQSEEALVWGIEALLAERAAGGWPAGALGFIGALDPLLDANRVRELEPSIRIVTDAGHGLAALLASREVSL